MFDAVVASWGVTIIAVEILLGWAFITSTTQTSRLAPRERSLDLHTGRLRRISVRRLRASRVPGRGGGWNRLIDEHDVGRIRAHLSPFHLLWLPTLLAFTALASLVIACSGTISMIFSHKPAPELALVGFGLLLVLMGGIVLIPGFTAWIVSRNRRSRGPLSWQILRHNKIVDFLTMPSKGRFRGEDPEEGTISISRAKSLLDPLEATVICALWPPRHASGAELMKWRDVTSKQLSFITERRVRLLSAPNDSVEVERVFDWMDLVADVVVYGRRSGRIGRLTAPREVIAPENLASARRTLQIGFWRSSLGAPTLLGAIGLAIVGITAATSAIVRGPLTSTPLMSEGQWIITGICVPVMVVILQQHLARRTRRGQA